MPLYERSRLLRLLARDFLKKRCHSAGLCVRHGAKLLKNRGLIVAAQHALALRLKSRRGLYKAYYVTQVGRRVGGKILCFISKISPVREQAAKAVRGHCAGIFSEGPLRREAFSPKGFSPL